jgi:hypothetical protein
MQQQQRPRDRIAQMQQMSGSSDFQPRHGDEKPQQMGEDGSGTARDNQQRERRLASKDQK